ncbi:MAG: glycoside hydrolase family 36 protein [Actinomycetota bacterium]
MLTPESWRPDPATPVDVRRDGQLVDGAHVVLVPRSDGWDWTLHVPTDTAVDTVRIEWDLGRADLPVPMFVNGWQSWSPTGWRTLGADDDASRASTLDFLRSIHHADPAVCTPGELRSEMVTVLTFAGGPPLLIGFLGGSRHDGTVRARVVDGRIRVSTEAWLGGARVPADDPWTLHPVVVRTGDAPTTLLAEWATDVGTLEGARTSAPFTVGWCSWYQYFERIDETTLRANLARAGDWPFTVFQLDDGYQSAVGDWLEPNDRFPSSLDALADAIRGEGCTPGLWLAPFLAAPDARVVRTRPELLTRGHDGEPVVSMFNDIWGGFVLGLDPTRSETRAHLEDLGRAVRDAGYDYAKLDFTFSPNVPGAYADPTATPAQRVRAGYDAFRRGFGDDGFILGCGAPLGACVGVVDAMRIGPDIAPSWEVAERDTAWPGYEFAAPALRHAWSATADRAFLHRRLWVNDPDCVMLRTHATDLTPDQAEGWARAVGASGGMVVVSDDLALLDPAARRLLGEVVVAGRAADARARDEAPAVPGPPT